MKLIADQKRRVVLPKPAKPGDVFEVVESGDRLVLVKLTRPEASRPPVSPARLFDMDADISEMRNIAADHPDVVARLTSLAERARVEIGDLDRPGRHARPAGRVEKPKPQVLRQ